MHLKLKAGWKPPQPPEGFPRLCVFRYKDGTEVIDFLNEESRSFANDEFESDVAVEWPWVDGFKPRGQDWEQAGFAFIC